MTLAASGGLKCLSHELVWESGIDEDFKEMIKLMVTSSNPKQGRHALHLLSFSTLKGLEIVLICVPAFT